MLLERENHLLQAFWSERVVHVDECDVVGLCCREGRVPYTAPLPRGRSRSKSIRSSPRIDSASSRLVSSSVPPSSHRQRCQLGSMVSGPIAQSAADGPRSVDAERG
jgi:hypothetical protein